MRELLARIDERQAASCEEAVRLREQITRLGEQLAAVEHRVETILEIAEDSDSDGSESLPSAYRQILALFEDDELTVGAVGSVAPADEREIWDGCAQPAPRPRCASHSIWAY